LAAFSSRSVLKNSKPLFADGDPGAVDQGEYAVPIAFLKAPLQSDFEERNAIPGIEMQL
jgi:hypothetical protein